MIGDLNLWSIFDLPVLYAAEKFSFIGEVKSVGLFDRGNLAFTILAITLLLAVILLTVNAFQVRARKKKEAERQKRIREKMKKSWK